MSSGHYSEDVSNRAERYASSKYGAFEASLATISALLQPAGATRESFGRHFLTAALGGLSNIVAVILRLIVHDRWSDAHFFGNSVQSKRRNLSAFTQLLFKKLCRC